MSSGGEAQKAIQALNGTELGGRTLTVNEAKPMERRDGGGGDRGNRSGGGKSGNGSSCYFFQDVSRATRYLSLSLMYSGDLTSTSCGPIVQCIVFNQVN